MSQQTRNRIAEWADLVGAEVPEGLDDGTILTRDRPLDRPN